MILEPDLLALRHVPSNEIVSRYGDTTSDLFNTAGQMEAPNVVVLPARNEQIDLPSTLLTLSRSTVPVIPIVVENGSQSEDKTCEYAERMGAVVLRCDPAKMRATQEGLRFARDTYPAQAVIHFGDADNLYPRVCIAAMAHAAQRANRKNNSNGAIVFGMGAYDHGPSGIVDLMRNARILRKAIQSKLSGESPMPYGANYALHIDYDDELPEALYKIEPRLFVREESEICKAATSAGATVSQLVRLSAYVLTRGDLIRTRKEWREFRGAPMDVKVRYYERNYPDQDFIPNPDGRENNK